MAEIESAKRATCWIDSKGELFHTPGQAKQSQAKINLRALLEEKGVCKGGPWDLEMVINVMMEDFEKLQAIFNAES